MNRTPVQPGLSLDRQLTQSAPWVRNAFTIAAAFTVYFCMYAFRKPFAAGTFSSESEWFGLSFKTTLVISQIIGYALSKYLGAHVLPSLPNSARTSWLLGLVGLAWAALLSFAMVSPILQVWSRCSSTVSAWEWFGASSSATSKEDALQSFFWRDSPAPLFSQVEW